ncbi:MAG: carbonic anhydrase [Streptomycetaceae bacterium]|nr:carbonic anhydrase [Streptomycetaceae bacterium]
MNTLIQQARTFHERATLHAESPIDFQQLADGQSPHALFITCSDSRVVPALITNAVPGELFELRTAGNVVPLYRPERPNGEAATIEYAVEVLAVSDIVVYGHSHCGAVGAVARRDDLAALPAVEGWLASEIAVGLDQEKPGTMPPCPGPELADAVQQHVLTQLERLHTYPGIQQRVAEGRMRLHAWFYEIHTGAVLAHRPQAGTFLPL